MKGFFNGLVFGIILGAAGFWFVQKEAQEHPEAQLHYEQSAARALTNADLAAQNMANGLETKLDVLNARADQISHELENTSAVISEARLDMLDLHAGEIKAELASTGEVIRREAHDIGETAVNAVSDARAVAEIKAKYAGDSTLSVWKISVSCDQGHVTLSGTVSSPDDIGKAVALALDTNGVRDVTSTLQVKPNQ